MNGAARIVKAADRFQQRQPWLALPVAVWKKFTDDHGGSLAALIAYYAFAAIFPLLLVLVTVLDITLRSDPALQARLVDSALAQYPVIGTQIKTQISAHGNLPGNGLPLVIGFVLLVLGARGVARAMQKSLCELWDVPRDQWPGFPWSWLYHLALMFVVGIGLVVTAFLSGLAGGAGHEITTAGAYAGAVVVSLAANLGMFWAGFRLATLRRVRWRDLRYGAAIAAVVWQVLLMLGGYVVSHQLQRASDLYGTFGVVLGLLAWLYLQATVTLYAAEVDVVLTRGLWPRSITGKSGEPRREPAQKAGSKTA